MHDSYLHEEFLIRVGDDWQAAREVKATNTPENDV
jgi:hypothetical protein